MLRSLRVKCRTHRWKRESCERLSPKQTWWKKNIWICGNKTVGNGFLLAKIILNVSFWYRKLVLCFSPWSFSFSCQILVIVPNVVFVSVSGICFSCWILVLAPNVMFVWFPVFALSSMSCRVLWCLLIGLNCRYVECHAVRCSAYWLACIVGRLLSTLTHPRLQFMVGWCSWNRAPCCVRGTSGIYCVTLWVSF